MAAGVKKVHNCTQPKRFYVPPCLKAIGHPHIGTIVQGMRQEHAKRMDLARRKQ